MTTTFRLKTLARDVGFSFEFGAKGNLPDGFVAGTQGYRCKIRYEKRQYSFDFFQGPGICHDPKKGDCLDCLLTDALAGDQSFEEFCGDFGYDTDSRSAYKLWKKCGKASLALRRLFGADYQKFLYADRN